MPVAPLVGGTKRAQQLLALVVAMALVLGSGAQAQPREWDLGDKVSIIVSKLNPFDRTPEATIERMGGEVTQDLPIVNGFAAEVPEKLVPSLASVPNVAGLRPNSTVKMEGQYGENSGVASAVYTDVHRASKAWSAGITGNGVNVAIIDTGVNTDGDLAGQVLHSEDFTSEQDHRDNYGHGTFVAGFIAGTGANSAGAVKGVAPGSKIVSIKIAGRDGSTDVTKLLAALQWVATYKDAYGIRVLNLSLGTTSAQSYLVDPLNFAVERLWNAGIVVVVAAGNRGSAARTIVKPADDPFVITVGASDDKTTVGHGDDVLASFSSVGPTASNNIAKPDLVASGKSVVSSRAVGSNVDAAFPNAQISQHYFKGSGTSFSSALVAGAAALMIQKTWNLSPNQVKARLMGTARAGLGGANLSGAGQLDAYAAAISTSTAVANQGVQPATGTGSLQATRSVPIWNPDTGEVMTDEQADAFLGFNRSEYFADNWAGSQWTGSQWTGSQWTGSQWTGSQWTGSQWTGSQWTGSQWTGSQWTGSQWTGSQWTAMDWAGSQWTGSQWTGSQWTGSQWTGSQWTGSQWTGSQWTGSQWTGSQWTGSQWTGSQWTGSQWTGSQWTGTDWTGLEWSGSHWG